MWKETRHPEKERKGTPIAFFGAAVKLVAGNFGSDKKCKRLGGRHKHYFEKGNQTVWAC